MGRLKQQAPCPIHYRAPYKADLANSKGVLLPYGLPLDTPEPGPDREIAFGNRELNQGERWRFSQFVPKYRFSKIPPGYEWYSIEDEVPVAEGETIRDLCRKLYASDRINYALYASVDDDSGAGKDLIAKLLFEHWGNCDLRLAYIGYEGEGRYSYDEDLNHFGIPASYGGHSIQTVLRKEPVRVLRHGKTGRNVNRQPFPKDTSLDADIQHLRDTVALVVAVWNELDAQTTERVGYLGAIKQLQALTAACADPELDVGDLRLATPPGTTVMTPYGPAGTGRPPTFNPYNVTIPELQELAKRLQSHGHVAAEKLKPCLDSLKQAADTVIDANAPTVTICRSKENQRYYQGDHVERLMKKYWDKEGKHDPSLDATHAHRAYLQSLYDVTEQEISHVLKKCTRDLVNKLVHDRDFRDRVRAFLETNTRSGGGGFRGEKGDEVWEDLTGAAYDAVKALESMMKYLGEDTAVLEKIDKIIDDAARSKPHEYDPAAPPPDSDTDGVLQILLRVTVRGAHTTKLTNSMFNAGINLVAAWRLSKLLDDLARVNDTIPATLEQAEDFLLASNEAWMSDAERQRYLDVFTRHHEEKVVLVDRLAAHSTEKVTAEDLNELFKQELDPEVTRRRIAEWMSTEPGWSGGEPAALKSKLGLCWTSKGVSIVFEFLAFLTTYEECLNLLMDGKPDRPFILWLIDVCATTADGCGSSSELSEIARFG